MKGKTSARRRINAEAGTAGKLASLLGIDGLAWLTDHEAALLVELLNFLDSEADTRGYNAGWDEALSYNQDIAYLSSVTLRTEH